MPSFRRKHQLPAALAPAIVCAPSQHRPLAGIDIQGAGIHRQEFVPAAAAEHLNQRRIGVEQLALRSAEVHAFLQGLKKFSKAAFFLALFGHVPGESADANDLVTLYDRIQHTVEVKRAGAVLHLDAHQTRPAALFQKARQTGFYIAAQRLRQKFVDLVAYDVCISDPKQLGDAAIHRSQRAIERAGKSHVIKRVDELLEASLGALNHLAQLVELLVGRRDAGAVAQIAAADA